MGKFDRLTFDDFKKLATDITLSDYEKIGFNDDYRKFYTSQIVSDIFRYAINENTKSTLDIGPGCSDVIKTTIRMLSSVQKITLVDSEEMLSQLPSGDNITKISGMFPTEVSLGPYQSHFDAIIVYSVLQHVFFELNPFSFIDAAVLLLAPGGKLFIGDIPNVSKKYRWSRESLDMTKESIDDSIIMAILMRYRNFGYETYLVPHNTELPLRNSRDNIIIAKRKEGNI